MTLTKLADDKFYALSAAAAELRDMDRLTHGVSPGESVRIDNVTEERGVLVVSGPRSRELLNRLTDADLGNDAFRWLRAREIQIAGQTVRALRVSYVGELGWELHPPIAGLPSLYDAIWKAGQEFGIANYGLYAVNTLRMEKAYKAWSSELTNELTTWSKRICRASFVSDKGDFVQPGGDSGAAVAPLQNSVRRDRRDRHGRARRGTGIRRRSLHRRNHLGCLRTSGQEESRIRLRGAGVRRTRQRFRGTAPRRAASSHRARGGGLRSRQYADEGLSHGHGGTHAGSGGHCRRRRNRLLNRLSPDQNGLARHRTARTQTVDQRHHLARRGPRRSAAPEY